MSDNDVLIPVTLSLPPDLYNRAMHRAQIEQRPVQDLLGSLLETALDATASTEELFKALSSAYRQRLMDEGRGNQSEEEIWQELDRVRDGVVRELYP